MSALRSSAGQAVSVIATPSSSATIRARLVFPRPGGAGEPELGLERLLADQPVEPGGPQSRFVFVAVAHLRGLDAVDLGPGRPDHRRATFRAWAISASGVSPGAPASSEATSCGEN